MMVISTQELISRFSPDAGPYEELYRQLHESPELSLQEAETARTVTEWLQKLEGFEIKTSVGGHGVVGILRNGPGKTVLLRAELDGLPVAEQTQAPYASTKTQLSVLSKRVEPVMHACGHDLHMAALLAASELLHASRQYWHGTFIALFQPSEENGFGAQAMFDEGLYDPERHNVPVPDVALGGHCMPLRAGLIKSRIGVINGSSDNFKVTMYGRGGHGSRPHTTIDPVVMAASTVMKLQTIVSRQMNPLEPTVITVGSLHAGSACNVIAAEAVLELNLRTFDSDARARLINLTTMMINNESMTWYAPKPPLFEKIGTFPVLENDETHTNIVAKAMEAQFGSKFAMDATRSAGSEDFAAIASPLSIPLVFWNFGCIDPETWDRAEKNNTLSEIAGNHSAYFLPALQPSLNDGMVANAVAALAYLR